MKLSKEKKLPIVATDGNLTPPLAPAKKVSADCNPPLTSRVTHFNPPSFDEEKKTSPPPIFNFPPHPPGFYKPVPSTIPPPPFVEKKNKNKNNFTPCLQFPDPLLSVLTKPLHQPPSQLIIPTPAPGKK